MNTPIVFYGKELIKKYVIFGGKYGNAGSLTIIDSESNAIECAKMGHMISLQSKTTINGYVNLDTWENTYYSSTIGDKVTLNNIDEELTVEKIVFAENHIKVYVDYKIESVETDKKSCENALYLIEKYKEAFHERFPKDKKSCDSVDAVVDEYKLMLQKAYQSDINN